MTSPLNKAKIRLIYVVVFLVAIVLTMAAFRWQVVDAAKFKNLAASRLQNTVIPALRGTIYASDGSTFAYSEPRYNVYVYEPELVFAERKGLQSRGEFVTKLAGVIDTTAEELSQLLERNFEKGVLWVKVATSITLETGEKVEGLTRDKDVHLPEASRSRLTGQFLQYTAERVYPEDRLASQVLGITSPKEEEGIVRMTGQGGVEGSWDGVLEPIVGFISGETDARGNAVGLAAEKTVEAKRGSSIYTTINKRLQQMIEEKLEWGVKQYEAKSGTIIVMEPTTGRILAMANYPTYNPNLRYADDPEAYGNKAVSEPYEIGSVGKVLTLSAALDLHKVTPDTVVINGHEGCEKIHKDLKPVCTADKRPQPPMPISEAFEKSDNLYFLHLAQRMAEEEFYRYLDRFGVGKPTGVDISGESFGYLKDYKYWNIADVSAYSYGHSYQITPLQATAAIAAVANYGVRMQPQIVSKVIETNGAEKEYKPVPLQKVISKQTVLLMDEMMHQVYQNSIRPSETYYNHLRKYKIAAKTGTALIPYRDRAGYSPEINATYVGYDASPDRKFIMLVKLEAPQVGDLSSQNARVLWLETFNAVRDVLGVRTIDEF